MKEGWDWGFGRVLGGWELGFRGFDLGFGGYLGTGIGGEWEEG